MVVAHLRGLLRPHHPYQRRSLLSEDIVLESLAAEQIAGNMERGILTDLSLMPVITEKGIHATIQKANNRGARAAELRLMNIYRVDEQLARKVKGANPHREISLYQLYQLAEKQGIFEAFDEHYTEENSKPLI